MARTSSREQSLRDRAAVFALRLRDAVPWSLPAALPGPSTLAEAAARAAMPDAAERAMDALASRYDVEPLVRACGPSELAESLASLEVLDRWLPERLPVGPGLDVGARNAANLGGLATAWPHGWDAVERDAHRRYWNTTTRRAFGESMARAFPRCRYLAGDVRDLSTRYSVVTSFLPFVTEGAHRAWGLPGALFEPLGVLRHVWRRVADGGVLIVVNQGEDESEAQGRLFVEAGIRAEPLGRVVSVLTPYRKERWAWRARREG